MSDQVFLDTAPPGAGAFVACEIGGIRLLRHPFSLPAKAAYPDVQAPKSWPPTKIWDFEFSALAGYRQSTIFEPFEPVRGLAPF